MKSKMNKTRPGEPDQGSLCDVAVVGAGPAGLMAAIVAARAGRSVLLIDRMPQPGRKLLVTGGGRCNLTNASEPSAMCAAFGEAARFVRPAITSFRNKDLLAFLTSLGVECSAADGFHYYPRSQSARDVLDALVKAGRASGVEFLTGCRVTAIKTKDNQVHALQTDKGRILVRTVILAAGGQSYPTLGSDGSGFTLAEALGIRIIPPVPALAGLKVQERWIRALSGVAMPDAILAVSTGASKAVRTRGELLFTHTGLSGPAALNVSRAIARALLENPDPEVRIDFVPNTPREKLEAAILDAAVVSGTRFVRTELARFLPASLAQALCARADASDTTLATLTARARKDLLRAVKECRVRVTATDSFRKAMVTSGGIDRTEAVRGASEGHGTWSGRARGGSSR